MLYLAWRQRFGKASPRTDLTNRRQEATKPFFKEIPPQKAASRNLLWNFLHRTTDSSSTGLSPLLQQPEGSPTTSHQNPNQQATGNQSADHTTPINKPQGTNQQTTRPRSTNCPASHTNPCHPRHRTAFAIAAHCISHRNALHKPTQRTAFPEVVRWEQTRSTSSVPQHCAATRHTCTPTAKEAFRGLPDMPLPHIKTEGQPHG